MRFICQRSYHCIKLVVARISALQRNRHNELCFGTCVMYVLWKIQEADAGLHGKGQAVEANPNSSRALVN